MKSLKQRIFRAKYRFWNRKAIDYGAWLEATQYAPRERLSDISLAKRQALVAHAWETVPFYRRHFDAHGFHPRDLKSDADWERVPFLTKEHLREHFDELVSSTSAARDRKLSTTGGSTGTPLKVYHDRRHPMVALGWRMLGWWGVPPAADVAYVYRLVRESLASRILNALYWWPTGRIWLDASQMSPASIGDFLARYRRLKPALVQGYAGAVVHLARHIEQSGEKVPPPQAVWVTASPISEADRAVVQRAFGAPVFDQYGCGEVFWIAAECPSHAGLHMFADARHVEVVDDDGRPSAMGEEGLLVITDLENRVFPIIRYQNDDRAALTGGACPCGRTLPLMSRVKGRVTDLLCLPDGSRIAGDYLTTIFDDSPDLARAFQVYQHADLSVTLRVVPHEGVGAGTARLQAVVGKLRQKCGDQVPVSLSLVASIPHDRGKLRYVVSEAGRAGETGRNRRLDPKAIVPCVLLMLGALFSDAADAGKGPPSPDDFVCTGNNDALCWQAAVKAAMPKDKAPYFAGLTGTPGARYIVRDTITIESAFGGTVDGNGSVLEWQGPPDRPLFLVKNTQQVKFTNLRIFVGSPLESAFEFTKAPYGKEQARNVAPSLNVLDGVRIEGVKLGNLRYGVRFSKRYGIDEDNDQSTIINTAIYNVTDAAISIEHTQSQHHHFYAVKATGAEGNRDAAFVRATAGSFSSLGGFHGRFGGAVYDITSVYGTDLILDENSEASARLIRTPDGMASFPMPVHVVGGRFAVDNMAADGRIVDFNRMGPLTISGLKVTGDVRPGAATPLISFRPQPVPAGPNPAGSGPAGSGQAGSGQAGSGPARGEAGGQLNLSGLTFAVAGSAGWDLVQVSPAARVNSAANSCVDGQQRVTRCRGLAAGVQAQDGMAYRELATGPGAALAPGHSAWCADCAAEPVTGKCQAGGGGQFARKLPGGWYCD